jgi:hypothetical protein
VRAPNNPLTILLRDMVFWLIDFFDKSACRRALPTEERATTFERIGEIMQLGQVQRVLLDDTVGVLLVQGFFREDA